VNLRLLRHLTSKKLPLIVSRGMASEKEVDEAVELFKSQSIPFALLHCISSYPTKDENANLRVIQALRERYACIAGYSDHTLGIRTPVLAVAAGASVIEKHFTLDRKMEGPDHALSCDPPLMQEMMKQIRETEAILGEKKIRLFEVEKPILQYRRVSR
jgi:sialic acid synthase SpsE